MTKLQVKVIYAKTPIESESMTNEALTELQNKIVRDVTVETSWAGHEDHYTTTIVYEE